MNDNHLAGLGHVSYELGKILDSPAQAAARRTENARRVPCPTCKAAPGVWCRTGSGRKSRQLHAARFNETRDAR
jgi:hypothetical protein